MTKGEKSLLSIFIAAQFSRTKNDRLLIKQIDEAIIKHITTIGGDPKNIIGYSPFKNDHEIDKFSIITLKNKINDLAPLFYRRAWLLFKATNTSKYYISDNPVTMHNENDFGLMGNLGLGVKGIEVYFPISSELSLGIFDESNEKLIRSTYETIKKSKAFFGTEENAWRRSKSLIRGLKTGNAIKSEEENVKFHNSMQVASSTRFVYSIDQNFELIYEMLKANPKFKEPPQIISN